MAFGRFGMGAGFGRMGAGGRRSSASPLLSKRSVINIGVPGTFNYAFINHYLSADGSTGFVGPSFASTASTWMQVIDSAGWPNTTGVSGNAFGGGVRIPSSSNFAGPYVITWQGDGEVFFNNVGTWTVQAGSSNYTEVANGRYTNTPGLVPRIVVNVSGLAAGPNLLSVQFLSTDPNLAARYLKNFKFYRLADEQDLLAGKVFRQAFKQYLVNYNPSAIRFMDWLGGNNCKNCRFENRTLPSVAGYNGASNWVASPVYKDANYTVANQYTLAAAAPTGANPKTTPASMVHGEIATCRMKAASVRNAAGGRTVNSISVAGATGTVQSTGHGFANGDTIIHLIPATNGMQQLNRRPVVISNVTVNSYDFGNATGFSPFVGGPVANCANQFVTLQVGSGSDRTPYPVMFPDGQSYASNFGDTFIALNDYKTFYFDKTISGKNDNAGSPVFGVWIFNDFGAGNGHAGDVPIEICTTLVNEVNAQALAQGKPNPIHMWMNIPHWGLSSMDLDYSAASDWAVNAVDVVINPSSSVRAGGYSALGYAGTAKVNNASLILEYSNETWNSGGMAFAQNYYLAQRGTQRWAGTAFPSNTGDYASMSALRSTVMARNVQAAFPGNPRIKLTLAGQGGLGYGAPYGVQNQQKCIGSSSYLNDSLVVSGNFGTPISNHDAFAHACYFDAETYYGPGNGPGTLTNDSAMYNGTDNSGLLTCVGGTGANFTATFVAANNNISGTNTFAAGDRVRFAATVGNVTAGVDHYVLATGLTGANFQVSLDNVAPLTPSTAGTSTATPSSTVLKVTSISAGGSIPVAQPLVGVGINSPATYVVSVSGVLPNLLVTLSQIAGVNNGTTIKSPVNGGGNYIGAANQALARQNFVNAVVAGAGSSASGTSQSRNLFCDPVSPTAGLDYQFSNAMVGFGKVSIQYEGGPDWQVLPGTATFGGHVITGPDQTFLTACINSQEWSTAHIAYLNASSGLTGASMRSVYLMISDNGGNGTPNQRWAYASPDAYASGTEGQALLNSAVWAAMSTRNQGLSP